jgi:transcriptional regulator with XRE-family HTH domain
MKDTARFAEAGARLRRARLAAGRTQADVAAIAATSQSSVSRIELGQAWTASISTVAAVATAVGLTLELSVRGPADASGATMQERCHRLVADLAARGGWTGWTTIDASDPSGSETLLIRSHRREVAVIHVWDVLGDVTSAYAHLERRIAEEASARGDAWAVSGAVVICATGHNRRRLSDAPEPAPDAFPIRGSIWLGALAHDLPMPRHVGMIWTDQKVERLRSFLPYLDHRRRQRCVTRQRGVTRQRAATPRRRRQRSAA